MRLPLSMHFNAFSVNKSRKIAGRRKIRRIRSLPKEISRAVTRAAFCLTFQRARHLHKSGPIAVRLISVLICSAS